MDRDPVRRQVVRARTSSGSLSMRTNIVGTHCECVTCSRSMSASASAGVEVLHDHDGAAEAVHVEREGSGAAWYIGAGER